MINLKLDIKLAKIESIDLIRSIFEKHEFVSYSSEYYLNIEYLVELNRSIYNK